jgi:hypothetical protein
MRAKHHTILSLSLSMQLTTNPNVQTSVSYIRDVQPVARRTCICGQLSAFENTVELGYNVMNGTEYFVLL